jgi:hypothetical protein
MTEPQPIALDVKLTRHAKRSDDGLNLGFAVHPHNIPREVADAPLGQLYKMVLVPVDENDSPVDWKRGKSATPKKSADITIEGSLDPVTATDKVHTQMTAPVPSTRAGRAHSVAPEKILVQQAAMCCQDPTFWNFLGVENKEDAAHYVRSRCGVTSRNQILLGTHAADCWEAIYQNYLGWKAEADA